ncbi:MAG: SGNH/GDSL hydrolase family protein [Planctomycetota bacterium]|jgi:acyl-CoA thioesterase-1
MLKSWRGVALTAACVVIAVAFSPQLKAEDQAAKDSLPRVLILGDSISIGYTPYVQKMMEHDAVVVRPMRNEKRPENCAGTTNGVQNIDRWLKIGGGNWDVIHFNFGLHDLKRVLPGTLSNSNDPNHPRQAEPDRYEQQLREIAKKLKATEAKLIFCTTTPVPEGGVKPHRDVEDAQRYNAIGRKIAEEVEADVNDLWAAAQPRLKEIQRPVNVHFTPEGSKFLAERVAAAIRKSLGIAASDSAKQ